MRRDNTLYCHKDYYNLFDATNCHICQNTIEYGTKAYPLNEAFVHMTCFQCTVCDISLVNQLKFGYDGVRPFCQVHTPAIVQQSPEVHPGGAASVEVTTTSLSAVSIKSESSDTSTTSTTDQSTEDSIEDVDGDDDLKSKKRTPRTKFTEKQTALMMEIFSQTPRPTRLMREHLAKTTGLPVRCIQIWFQNKRSKEKRQNSKRYMTSMTSPASMYGPPMYQTMFHPPIYPAGVVPQTQGHFSPPAQTTTTLPSPHVSPSRLYPTPPPPECINNPGLGSEVPQFHEKMEEFFIPPEQQQPPSFETALQNHQTYPSPTWSSEGLDFNMTSGMEL